MPLARSNFPTFSDKCLALAASIASLKIDEQEAGLLATHNILLSFFARSWETFLVLAEYLYKELSARIVRVLETF